MNKRQIRLLRKLRKIKAQLNPDKKAQAAKRASSWLKRAKKLRDPAHETMPYEAYLQTEYWQCIRKHVFAARGLKCEVCNARHTELHVHHKSYQFRGREHLALNTLQILCAYHHKLAHSEV